jgi:hypothetical protein
LGTLPEPDELGLLDELLLHAAKARAAHAATDVSASLRLERKTNETTSFCGLDVHAQNWTSWTMMRGGACAVNRRLQRINAAVNIQAPTLK